MTFGHILTSGQEVFRMEKVGGSIVLAVALLMTAGGALAQTEPRPGLSLSPQLQHCLDHRL
jgi:hypothetical protein